MTHRPLTTCPGTQTGFRASWLRTRFHLSHLKRVFTFVEWTDRIRWRGSSYTGAGPRRTPDSPWPCTVSAWSLPPPSAVRRDNRRRTSPCFGGCPTRSLNPLNRGWTSDSQCPPLPGWSRWTSVCLTLSCWRSSPGLPASDEQDDERESVSARRPAHFAGRGKLGIVSDDWKPKLNAFLIGTLWV